MSAYLVTVCISRLDTRTNSIVEGCSSAIIYGAPETDAVAFFEAGLNHAYTSETAGTPRLLKTVAAPVLSELLTDEGAFPIDWPKLSVEVLANLEATVEIANDLGYWLDCDATIPAENISRDADALRARLPEDISSALNWQPGTTSFFLVSALKPPVVLDPDAEFSEGHETDAAAALRHSMELESSYPELAEREIVAVIQARNAAVATWLWRRHVQNSPLTHNQIRLEVWPGAAKCGQHEQPAPE